MLLVLSHFPLQNLLKHLFWLVADVIHALVLVVEDAVLERDFRKGVCFKPYSDVAHHPQAIGLRHPESEDVGISIVVCA